MLYPAELRGRRPAGAGETSMGPGLHAVEAEIVRVGDALAGRFLGFDHAVVDALALGIGDRFLAGLEGELDLLVHVAGAGIAHDRVDRPRLFGVEFQNPEMGLGLAGLHGGLGGTIDLRGHRSGSRILA